MTYTLLLADDSVTIQRVIELTFAEEDIRVVTVGDGQLAIDRLETSPPDIVLADVDMPKRDGYEVAAYVKSRPKLAHIPVVLLTGAFEPIDQARATAAGSSDVLAKPFEPQMVINRVKQLLGKKREEEVLSPSGGASPPPAQRPSPSIAPTNGAAINTGPPAQQVPPVVASSATAAPVTVSLDDYFDQLDAAFSNLQHPAAAPKHDSLQVQEDWMLAGESDVTQSSGTRDEGIAPPVAPAGATGPHLVTAPQPAPQTPLPLAPPVVLEPKPAPVSPASAHVSSAVASAPVAMASPPPDVVQTPDPSGPAVMPSDEQPTVKTEAAVTPLAPVITDEVIEQVVSRVLQRLSDRVVRETVANIVSETAERLVQDEILRIKSEGQE